MSSLDLLRVRVRGRGRVRVRGRGRGRGRVRFRVRAEVYGATYLRMQERNRRFYERYPQVKDVPTFSLLVSLLSTY